MPVGELLQRIDSRELSEWMAVEYLEHRDRTQAELAREAMLKLGKDG